MRALRSVPIVLLALMLSAYAQQPSTAVPASREQILKLFEVMHIRQQMRVMTEAVVKQQSALVHDTIKKRYPQVTEKDMAQLDDYMTESMKDFPIDGMLDDMIPVYQKHLTQPDVEAMITFYSSPTGQKLMKEMPAMTSEGMQAAYPRMQEQMEKMMQRVEEKMKPKPGPQPKKENRPTPAPQTTPDDSTS